MNTHFPLSLFDIARMCHEANRTYCALLDDHSQPVWDDAPQWQKDSAIAGVRFHLANPTAGDDASHMSWMQAKLEEGWTYGPVKDPDAKRHPCMVPFEDLPAAQKLKDRIFRSMVHALASPQDFSS